MRWVGGVSLALMNLVWFVSGELIEEREVLGRNAREGNEAGSNRTADPKMECYSTSFREHFCVVAPLCIRKDQLEILTPPEKYLRCNGLGPQGTIGPITEREKCSGIWTDNVKDSEFQKGSKGYSIHSLNRSWIQMSREEGNAEWISGSTYLQALTSSSGNIGHYSEKIFMLQHVLAHPGVYLSRVRRVILFVPKEDMKFFDIQSSWHYGVLSAMIHPLPIHRRTHSNDIPDISPPGAHLFRKDIDQISKRDFLCFEEAHLGGHLKKRSFMSDHRLKKRAQDSWKDGLRQPWAAKNMRLKLSSFGRGDQREGSLKVIVYSRRTGRRSFHPSNETKFVAMLEETAHQGDFKLKIADFNSKSFLQQLSLMNGASILLGLHGANLANAKFLPSFASMMEIFPYGFHHEMYINGSNSGIQYFNYTVQSGPEFPHLDHYGNREECLQKSILCRIHYRCDRRDVVITEKDLFQMKKILRKMMEVTSQRLHLEQ